MSLRLSSAIEIREDDGQHLEDRLAFAFGLRRLGLQSAEPLQLPRRQRLFLFRDDLIGDTISIDVFPSKHNEKRVVVLREYRLLIPVENGGLAGSFVRLVVRIAP